MAPETCECETAVGYDARLVEMLLYRLLMAVPSCCIPTMQARAMNVISSAYSTRSWPSSSWTNRTSRFFMVAVSKGYKVERATSATVWCSRRPPNSRKVLGPVLSAISPTRHTKKRANVRVWAEHRARAVPGGRGRRQAWAAALKLEGRSTLHKGEHDDHRLKGASHRRGYRAHGQWRAAQDAPVPLARSGGTSRRDAADVRGEGMGLRGLAIRAASHGRVSNRLNEDQRS